MMAITIKPKDEVNTVADLARYASKYGEKEGRLLFRGQNTDQPLKPKIARKPAFDVVQEKKMLDRFKRESGPFLSGLSPDSDWDWLSIAQHQGMSTRLLDWSANALAALWFAVSQDPPDDETHGVVWMLSADEKDLKTPGVNEDIWTLNRTYVFQPFHIDRRIAAQSGWFSVHKYLGSKKEFLALNSNTAYSKKLKQLKVPIDSFPSIRKELRHMGMTRATLFPDLSGLCADIDEEFLNTHASPLEI